MQERAGSGNLPTVATISEQIGNLSLLNQVTVPDLWQQEAVAALRAGQTTVEGAATFEDGYRTQLVLDAARRSHESGCWEKVEWRSRFPLPLGEG